MATFTYSSRLPLGINRLDAKFGLPLEKNFPRFIHGCSNNANVTSSDKRGKIDSWGLLARDFFPEFTDIYPEQTAWGLGAGEMVGVPNSMDISQAYGMICGNGMPGGWTYFLSVDEKQGRVLDPFLHDFSDARRGIPRMNVDTPSVSSVWIAKSPAIPTMTRGLVGMLSGTSSGVVTACSLGATVLPRDERLGRGDLTARWVLSPGVPIVALSVDEEYSEERMKSKRIWAVALNALGEIFYLDDMPTWAGTKDLPEQDTERGRELRAWETGKSTPWQLLRPTLRHERRPSEREERLLPYFPTTVLSTRVNGTHDMIGETRTLESWLHKRPIDIREDFHGFDMRRRLLVDYAGDDAHSGGEAVFVVDCGFDDDVPAAVRRYTRCRFSGSVAGASGSAQDVSTRSTETDSMGLAEWRTSQFSFARFKNIKITASAFDLSKNATVTATEEPPSTGGRHFGDRRLNAANPTTISEQYSPFKMPGQRARLFALGTAAGTIFVWNARAPLSTSVGLSNSVAPARIIHTQSPEISCLALSSLYLVHGGSEGLVQAWDPLASTLEPIRTISSRSTLNARRRAVIAASNDPSLHNQFTTFFAAKAICLDSDPTVLRGVVAIGAHLRYWSYSSVTADDELSKTQKRRMRRTARGLNPGAGEGFPTTRRVGLKGFVEQEKHRRDMDEREAQVEEREQRRVAKRFGLELLGHDASEEEMIAYATILSEEDHENKQRLALEDHLVDHSDSDAIEAYKSALSMEDSERWKFASWRERLSMPLPELASAARSSEVHTPVRADTQVDDNMAEAIRLSLGQASESSTRAQSKHTMNQALESLDDDIAAAIHLSLLEQQDKSESIPARSGSSAGPNTTDEDMLKAIELSIELNGGASPYSSPWMTPSHGTEWSSSQTAISDHFPPLGSPTSSSSSTIRHAKRKGKGRS